MYPTAGTCLRRCGTEGCTRSLAIRAEGEEEDASKVEEDKFFYNPQGYGMGFQMMAHPLMHPVALGLPQSFGFLNPYSSSMWLLPAPWRRPFAPVPAPRPFADPIYNCMLMRCAQNTPLSPPFTARARAQYTTKNT